MSLPRRIPKEPKRSGRWKSPAHLKWIRGFECCVCGSQTNIAAAHVRLGSGAGMGQKPDDWRTVPLCDGPYSGRNGMPGCHDTQHSLGEETFWFNAGLDPERLIDEFADASPRRQQIREARNG